jgi:hypothetical protein
MLALNKLLHPSPDITSTMEGHVVYFVRRGVLVVSQLI